MVNTDFCLDLDSNADNVTCLLHFPWLPPVYTGVNDVTYLQSGYQHNNYKALNIVAGMFLGSFTGITTVMMNCITLAYTHIHTHLVSHTTPTITKAIKDMSYN